MLVLKPARDVDLAEEAALELGILRAIRVQDLQSEGRLRDAHVLHLEDRPEAAGPELAQKPVLVVEDRPRP